MDTVKQKRKRRRGPRTKYPWDEWYDTLAENKLRGPDYWMVLGANDFDSTIETFSKYFRKRAGIDGKRVEVQIEEDQLYIRLK